jgi:hypothetical protein
MLATDVRKLTNKNEKHWPAAFRKYSIIIIIVIVILF